MCLVMQNAPSENVWLFTILGNSIVISAIQMLWSALIVPYISLWLSCFKFRIKNIESCEPNILIRVFKTQVRLMWPTTSVS